MPEPRPLVNALAAIVTVALGASSAPAQQPADRPDTPTIRPVPGQTSQPVGGEGLHANPMCSPDPVWTIQVEPALWWTSPSGSVKLPGGTVAGDSVRVERLNLDTPQFTPMGTVSINADRFRFSFAGSSYNNDEDTVADSAFTLGTVDVLPGDDLDTSFGYSFFQAIFGYRFYTLDYKARSSKSEDCADLLLRLYGIGGLRLTEVEFGIDRRPAPGLPGASSSTQQVFLEPVAGVRAEIDIVRDFSAELQLSGGGFAWSEHASFDFEIVTGFTWRPIPEVGVQVGWRQALYSMTDGDGPGEFRYEGAMAGVFLNLVIRF